jgi:hypothetical protein
MVPPVNRKYLPSLLDIRDNKLDQRIILFSPTALNESNRVFKNLKNLSTDDIYLEYTDEISEEFSIDIKNHIDEVNEIKFTLPKLRHIEDEEKIIPSCLDTCSPMIAPPVLPQSAFCALKKTDCQWPKLDRFKFLILDILSAWRVSSWKASPNRWAGGRPKFNASESFSIGFGNGLSR